MTDRTPVPTQIRAYALRSGDRINNARDTWGMIFSLLLPFLSAGLKAIETHTTIRFGENYLDVLQGTLITLGGSILARIYMRQIGQADRAEAVAQGVGQARGEDQTGQDRDLRDAEAELRRLRQELAEVRARRDGPVGDASPRA